jgi:hypothetical protein
MAKILKMQEQFSGWHEKFQRDALRAKNKTDIHGRNDVSTQVLP